MFITFPSLLCISALALSLLKSREQLLDTKNAASVLHKTFSYFPPSVLILFYLSSPFFFTILECQIYLYMSLVGESLAYTCNINRLWLWSSIYFKVVDVVVSLTFNRAYVHHNVRFSGAKCSIYFSNKCNRGKLISTAEVNLL